MSQIWEYNGEQFEFDLMDAETADRYDQALKKMEENEKRIKQSGKLSETIRNTCDMVYEFFDDVFGEEISNRIIEKNYNLRACSEVYFGSFIPFANKQVEEINAYYNRMKPAASSRKDPLYKPVGSVQHSTLITMQPAQPNREQRRRSKKKKK